MEDLKHLVLLIIGILVAFTVVMTMTRLMVMTFWSDERFGAEHSADHHQAEHKQHSAEGAHETHSHTPHGQDYGIQRRRESGLCLAGRNWRLEHGGFGLLLPASDCGDVLPRAQRRVGCAAYSSRHATFVENLGYVRTQLTRDRIHDLKLFFDAECELIEHKTPAGKARF